MKLALVCLGILLMCATAQSKPKEHLLKGMFSLKQEDLPKSFTKKDTRR